MIRFAVFTDLHFDRMHDGTERVQEFLNNIKEERLDFIISLGDLCYPTEKNNWILDEVRNRNVPVYFAVGNHDTDYHTQEEVKSFLGVNTLNTSFVIGKTKFLILNTCYMKKDQHDHTYQKKKYEKGSFLYPVIPNSEVEWLKEEMKNEDYNYVVFSHHSLANEFPQRGVVNRKEIQDILSKRKTILCMNGHDHGQDCTVIGEIPYYTLNSMSYIWHGLEEKYAYDKEIHEQYPILKDIIPYSNALHCVVEVDDTKVNIFGMQSNYQSVIPEDVGIVDRTWNGVSVQPSVLSCEYTF